MVARRRRGRAMTHKTLSTWSSFACFPVDANIRRKIEYSFRFFEVRKGWHTEQVLCMIKHVYFVNYRHGRGGLMDDHR